MKVSTAVEKYTEWKRQRGILFEKQGNWFLTFAHKIGNKHLKEISSVEVLRFLSSSTGSDANWWQRYKRVRAFFQFWVLRGELERPPMPRPRAASPSPFRPHIYTNDELKRMLAATAFVEQGCFRSLDSLTLRTILLFIYGAGAQVREAISLGVNDLDLDARLVTLKSPNTERTRKIPIGQSLCASLRAYLVQSAERRGTSEVLFVSWRGLPIHPQTLAYNFQRLRVCAGLSRRDGVRRPPQIRDLRHTFAVHCLEAWIRRGRDIYVMLPALSAYLGHIKWSHTEQYLAMAPSRLQKHLSRLASNTGTSA